MEQDVRSSGTDRAWLAQAIAILRSERARSPDTRLIALPLSNAAGIQLYLKDEAAHLTGSLKHRLALSLFQFGLCNGWIGPCTTVVEASSGSTAVSEAYFARRLGLKFIAVVPAGTSPEKLRLIEAQGGACHKVADPSAIYDEARRLAEQTGGYYMDQFSNAERAADWKDEDNIARAIFAQLREEADPVPAWIVCGAGTGGTSATIGRHIRYAGYATRLCVADPEASVFHRHYADRSVTLADGGQSCIEGIGRPRLEPSFMPAVIDRMMVVGDADGIAAMHHLSTLLGRPCGPSTGVNILACLRLVDEMVRRGTTGSIVTLLCDSGERYRSTCFNQEWLARHGFMDHVKSPLLDSHLPLPLSLPLPGEGKLTRVA